MPFCSNVMLVGDARKFISALVTLRVDSLAMDMPSRNLAPEAIDYFAKHGITGLKTVEDAIADKRVQGLVDKAVEETNLKVVSRAAKIKKWAFLLDDFTIPGGELTPTLKLKRPIVLKKNAGVVENIYAVQN